MLCCGDGDQASAVGSDDVFPKQHGECKLPALKARGMQCVEPVKHPKLPSLRNKGDSSELFVTGRGTREATGPRNLHTEGPRFPAPDSNSQPLLYLKMNRISIPEPCPLPPRSTAGLFNPRQHCSFSPTGGLLSTVWHLVLGFFSCCLTISIVCL